MNTKPGDDELDVRASELVKSVLGSCQRTQTSEPQPDNDQQHDFEIRNIDWVACKDFTISVGKTQIEKYIGTWEVHPRWLFTVKFLQENELEFKKEFLYKALWSIPTRRCPIAKSTASVYFTISISKHKAHTTPVLVTFQVEGSETVHVPGKTRFREIWLKNVIESKILLMGTIIFKSVIVA